ncbi:unnamed protein product, partial [Didymodactylos carnosus]
RGGWEFGGMIAELIPGYSNRLGVLMDYNGYGCWCGPGSKGKKVVDATDLCCKIHDECWAEAERDHKGCEGNSNLWAGVIVEAYSYTFNDATKTIECSKKNDACESALCACDKDAATCFAKNRCSFRKEFKDYKGTCKNEEEEDFKDSADICEKCYEPWSPLGNGNGFYTAGNKVSYEGVNYIANHWVIQPPSSANSHASSDGAQPWNRGKRCT